MEIRKTDDKEAKDILEKFKPGDADVIKKVKQNINVSDKYKADNFELIPCLHQSV